MRFALCLYRYFPYGGMQRNFLRIAEECRNRGHTVDVYTMRWEGGPPPADINVHLISVRGWRNHQRHERFADQLARKFQQRQHDLIVGFNKMPGLDAYYAADPCYLERAHTERSALIRFTPRYRHFLSFERAVFGPQSNVRILLLSPKQQKSFQQWYDTPSDRFALLPPYVAKDRIEPAASEAKRVMNRRARRRALGMSEHDMMLLMVGSDFYRKGVDRAIRALAEIKDEKGRHAHLVVIGRGRAARYRMLAKRLGIDKRVHLLQARDDVGEHLAAADLLLHVAREENTGTAIVEAIAAGLPVLVTGNCGYAFHVAQSGAGAVLEEPFDQAKLNQQLATMVSATVADFDNWRERARTYATQTDLFSRPQYAVSLLERWASKRCSSASCVTSSDGAEQSTRTENETAHVATAREGSHG